MANYSNLKAAIEAAIKTNGNQEITGQLLQDVLTSMVSVIGANYTFAGVATPSTNPGTPDQNVVYMASQGGTYTNFGGIQLPAGISLLMWNGAWTSNTVMYGDGGVFDISVYKSSGGTLATFADLAAALDGGNNIPASARNGGMSVKFVQSSDNNYIQARLMANAFTTDITKWQVVDDEPANDSKNLVESGGVYNAIKKLPIDYDLFEDIHPNLQNRNIWDDSDTTNRVSPFFFVPARSIKKVSVTSGYDVTVLIFKNGSIEDRDESEFYWAKEHIIPEAGENDTLRYQVRKTDNSDVTPAEGEENTTVTRVAIPKVIELTKTTPSTPLSSVLNKYCTSNYETVSYVPKSNTAKVVLPKTESQEYDFDLKGDEIFIVDGKQYVFRDGQLRLLGIGKQDEFLTPFHPLLVYGNVYADSFPENRAKTGFLNDVAKIVSTDDYEFAVLVYSDDGITPDTTYYAWKTVLELPRTVRNIRFHVRKKDNSDLNLNDTMDAVTVYSRTPKFVGKKISLLGDSLTAFGVPNQQNATGTWTYAGNLCRYPQNDLFGDVDMMWWKRLIDNTGLTLDVNESIRGTLVSWDGVTESETKGADKYFGSPTRIAHLDDNGTPDIIIVQGGANDASDHITLGTFNQDDPTDLTDAQIAALPVNTFCDAYRTMLIRLIKSYPNAQIVCVIPPYCAQNNVFFGMDVLNAEAEAIYKITDYFGIPVVDWRKANMSFVRRQTIMSADGIHPNSMGHYLIYKKVIDFLFSNQTVAVDG